MFIKVIAKILYWMVLGILAVVLCFNLGIAVMRLVTGDEMPLVLGYGNAIVTTGSMEPTIGINAMIITHVEESYSVGDIVTYPDPDSSGSLITHRIVDISEDGYGFITKGDANNTVDRSVLQYGSIIGKVIYSIPNFGIFIEFLRSPLGILSIIILGFIIYMAPTLISSKADTTDNDETDTTGDDKADDNVEKSA